MKMRDGLLVTCAASALMIGIGFAPPALAADMVTKAPVAEALPWWYEGFVEVGGRFNMNGPDKSTLGKFYEYRDLRPGVFGNFYIAAHRRNPIDFAVWGTNVGWDDQAFGLDYANVGTFYMSLGWDETPHVYAKNAMTTYTASGNVLTSPAYVAANGAVPTAATQAFVNGISRQIDVGYRRDTASAKLRWTPTEAWDITADYSHMHRDGTQPLNTVSFTNDGASARRTAIELAKPVDDTTQNANLKGEYSGSTPWGKPFNIALGGGISQYSADYNSVIWNNPWNVTNAGINPLWNRYSLAPDNKAQTISLSGGVGLPFNSRYMGTFQYTHMEQDDPFLPASMNPLAVAVSNQSRSSLNGDASTTLFNNVLHTQITSNLKSTLRYRYYDYNTDHSQILVNGNYANPDTNNTLEGQLVARGLNYKKQNAGADLAWQALKWLTVGTGYGWERWDRAGYYADVATTNENTVKVFADARWDWSTLRTSLQYGERRFDGPYVNNTANNNDAVRVKEYADRDQFKGMASWAIQLPQNVEITPNGGFRYDDYKTDPFQGLGVSEIGIRHDDSWNAGIELSWTANRSMAFYAAYNYESGYRQVYQNSASPDLNMETRDRINTFMLGGKFTVIPEKLTVNASYTYLSSTSNWDSSCAWYGCRYAQVGTMVIYQEVHNKTHRLDVQAKYMFDDAFVRSAGWSGKAFVKARVMWEKNDTDNWQPLTEQLGYALSSTDTTLRRAVFLATGNPNYDVVLGQVSFGVKW